MNKQEKIKSLFSRAEILQGSVKKKEPVAAILRNLNSILSTVPNTDKDIKPLLETIKELRNVVESSQTSVLETISNSRKSTDSSIKSSELRLTESNNRNLEALIENVKKVKSILESKISQSDNTRLLSKRQTDADIEEIRVTSDGLQTKLDKVIIALSKELEARKSTDEEIKSDLSSVKKKVKELESGLDESKVDTINRLSSFEGKLGGGSMNRQIKLAGVDILKKYTDINLIAGSNMTITAVADDVDKNVDITFNSSGGGGGGGSLAFETPSGTINDTNTSFTVANTPLYLVVNTQTLFENNGYTLSGLNITLTNPIGTGGWIKSAYGSAVSFDVPSGTINDTNVTFTATSTPKYLVVNTQTLFENYGYTLSGLTITLSYPVGTGGWIKEAL